MEASLCYEAVREDLLGLLRESQLSDAFVEALQLALSYDGKVLSPKPRSRWPLFVLLSCWGAGGDWRKAVPAATAAEIIGVATDVFDEIEDGDRCLLAIATGSSRAINVASALLVLAWQSLSRAPLAVGAPLWQGLLQAADGQHRDLGREVPSSPQEYLNLVDRKSAGLTACLCALGAGLAGDAASAGYAQFGLFVGRWAQLLNDLHDLWPGTGGKSDLDRRLVTLPVIYVLAGPPGPVRARFRRYLSEEGPLAPSEEQILREALWASGALHYTWLMAETNRSAAEAALRAVCPSPRLETILELLLPPVPEVEQFRGS